MLGCHKSRLFSKASYELYADKCATSYLPLVIDDPKSNNTISDLTVALFNGAEEGTMNAVIGSLKQQRSFAQISLREKPKGTYNVHLIIAAVDGVYTVCYTHGLHRYTSRTILIPFAGPPLDISLTCYAELPDLLDSAASCIGHLIGLGKRHHRDG